MVAVTDTEIRELVQNDELMQAWQEYLAGVESAELEERQRCLAAVASQRNEFLETWEDVSDEQDRTVLTAIFYIFLKSQWMMINTRCSYLLSNGQIDPTLMCRSGLISALLGRVERALTPQDVERITQILSAPLGEDDLFPLPRVARAPAPKDLNEYALFDRKLETTFGRVSAEEIIGRFTDLNSRLAALEEEENKHRNDSALLKNAMGTPETEALIYRFRTSQSRLAQMEELSQLMGSIEDSVQLFGN
jgi:hypothetical protein